MGLVISYPFPSYSKLVFYSRFDLQQSCFCPTYLLSSNTNVGLCWAMPWVIQPGAQGSPYSSPEQKGLTRAVWKKNCSAWHSGCDLWCGLYAVQLQGLWIGLGSKLHGFQCLLLSLLRFSSQRESSYWVCNQHSVTSWTFYLSLFPCKLHFLLGKVIKGFMREESHTWRLWQSWPTAALPPLPARSSCLFDFPCCGPGSGRQGNIYL